ncbi:hypothetical protein SAMN05421741_11921 [Paenimyroides ummariense]|uniref:Uncharacterized protein n=1 Tax=Paenimyroides ummariense TaxID=913024 RepID=A0A1I5E7I9_9FLAO|nr:hypothetical protein [Paenimyroides ummariense]SFO07427.1 hypothetical protein SAMN05421741_11921 [Paenimyroides ummariense]
MTRQADDILYIDNKKIYLNNFILEDYFDEFPEKRPVNNFVSTAMWRGYIAEFEIRDNQLFVLNRDYNLGDLFPNNGKYDWYSGLIRIDDFRDEFDLEPINGIFEYLEILDGNFIQRRIFTYEELQDFKKEQYEYFLLSEEIETVYEFWRKNNENGVVNKENLNTIIAENIMTLTKRVYVK